jgi:hypothetical protein
VGQISKIASMRQLDVVPRRIDSRVYPHLHCFSGHAHELDVAGACRTHWVVHDPYHSMVFLGFGARLGLFHSQQNIYGIHLFTTT